MWFKDNKFQIIADHIDFIISIKLMYKNSLEITQFNNNMRDKYIAVAVIKLFTICVALASFNCPCIRDPVHFNLQWVDWWSLHFNKTEMWPQLQ